MIIEISFIQKKKNIKNIEWPELQGAIIEPLLTSCLKKSSFNDIAYSIQKIMQISFRDLKRYLFYLIEYGLVSYDGQNQKFTIEDGGFDLLDMINEEKIQERTDINDITITFEYSN